MVRKPKPKHNDELVQTRISHEADLLLSSKAKAEALSVAAYVRRLLYKDLGVMP